MGRILATTLMALLLGAPAQAQNATWQWVMASPNEARPWSVSQGTGYLRFDGNKLTADLKLDPALRKGANLRLEGTIAGDQITVTVTRLNTDARPERFHGTIQRKQAGDGWETDRISLSGEWGNFLGISGTFRHSPGPQR